MRAALEVVRRRALLVLRLGAAALPLAAAPAAAENEKAAAVFAALAPLLATKEDAADAEQRDIMPVTSSLPWGAVGFLDNGCTGALIDSQHVLAASHCFTFDFDGVTADGQPYLQGAWQTGLVFFPNYHPSRANPPRYEIDRVIVGSRAQTDPATAADWGIAHLTKPVTGFPALQVSPRERWQYPSFVLFAGYGRDEVVYPNEAASFPEPSPGGFCANFKPNCWWIPAFTDPKCLALDEVDGIVRTDEFSCRTLGGNSGSPVLWQAASLEPQAFRVTGVISGGGSFWSAQRFQHAPRFAAGVAVASHDDGTPRTQVFATDRDRSRIASRHRAGASAAQPFTYFRDLGSVPSPGPLAAFRLPDGRPQVVVLGGDC
jgi:V8-like Glu-specific endopeptidase